MCDHADTTPERQMWDIEESVYAIAVTQVAMCSMIALGMVCGCVAGAIKSMVGV